MGNNKDFEYIWKVLQKADKLFGNNVMQSTPLTWYQKIYRTTWFVVFVIEIVLHTLLAISNQSNLDLLLISISSGFLFILGIAENLQLLYYKRECMEILDWCRKIQKIQNSTLFYQN